MLFVLSRRSTSLSIMERGSRDSSPSSSAGDIVRVMPPHDAESDAEALPQYEAQAEAASAGAPPSAGEPTGSHEMEPQPGPSGAATRKRTNPDPDLANNPGPSNSEAAQDNVSSAAAAAGAPEASLGMGFPDEGSNSEDFWAASSSGGANSGASRSGSGENLFEESSRDSNDDDLMGGAAQGPASNAPSSAGPSGMGKMNGVPIPLSSFSPQPSSSNSNGIAAGSALAIGGSAASSSFSLLANSVSSSPAMARSAPGIITSSGRGPGMNTGGSQGQHRQSSQPQQRPPSPIPGPSGYVPPGEISNPPSPLGGGNGGGASGPMRIVGDRSGPPRAGMKRHYRAADSAAVAGPSGVGQGWKRANSREDQAVPASSGMQQHGTSEAAAVPRPRSPLSAHHSPIRQPLTPADHFMISSSTGLIDSVPPTPDAMDVLGGDNDLSVPSPADHRRQNATAASGSNANGGGIGLPASSLASSGASNASGGAGAAAVALAAARALRGIEDEDEMVDSTVDSSGIPMQRESSSMDVGESGGFCQSSRYADNSDDEDSEGNQIASQHLGERGDEGISTSGQVDEGQFRLVPNNPEDDMFNSRNPPRRQPILSRATFRELDPVPGPSKQVTSNNEY